MTYMLRRALEPFFVRFHHQSQLSYRVLSSSTSKPHTPDFDTVITPLKNAVKEQGNLVRRLKENNASKDVINNAVADLKAKKQQLKEKELAYFPPVEPINKASLHDLLKKRFFYDQSFSIYGGMQGLYDYGPMGCAVQANLLQEWRKFFIVADRMLEVDCPVLTPEPVLRASGHVARFADYLVSDAVTGESFRADHLLRRCLEELLADRACPAERKQAARVGLASLDSLGADGLQKLIDSFAIKSPVTRNALTQPRRFNLMLETAVGAPSAPTRVFLRPETAQGIFVNFARLLDFNNGRLPMAVAQTGRCFRNEIAPRSGLTRLREFTLAEIEHFYDPADSSHPGFASVANLSLPLLSAADQAAAAAAAAVSATAADAADIAEATWRPLHSALASTGGPIANETLAYYLGRVFLFLTRRCGLDPRRGLRFRQHPPGEMAHYASDCWDAEYLTAGGLGWVEIVGCADRAAYDLTQHSTASGERLTAERRRDGRRVDTAAAAAAATDADCGGDDVQHTEVAVDRALLADAFQPGAGQEVESHLNSLSPQELLQLAEQLDTSSGSSGVDCQIGGVTRRLPPGLLTRRSPQPSPGNGHSLHIDHIIPCVVEPSFGVGRIVAAALEHGFRFRSAGDKKRTYLSLPPHLAPYKCVLLPMSGATQAMSELVAQLSGQLSDADLAYSVDATPGASIGKRYARNDQIGVPYAVTVDFQSIVVPAPSAAPASASATVTLRERDSMQQVRIEADKVAELIHQLVWGRVTWQQVMETHPVVFRQSSAAAVNA